MKYESVRRFNDEILADHWKTDETKESFNRLLRHLEVNTNFRPYFESALKRLGLDSGKFTHELVVADVGAGTCWTSAILAKHPKVKVVYAVDPSHNRLKHGKYVVKHLNVEDKVRIIQGSFLEPNVPEKADLIVLCGSLHHCFDQYIKGLFLNMKRLIKPGGKLLIANEHYVNWIWSLKRVLGYIYHIKNRKNLHRSLLRPRAPDPVGGEHWRTRRELERIFNANGFTAQFFIHKGDLCKNKRSFYRKIGWCYYYAILAPEESH